MLTTKDQMQDLAKWSPYDSTLRDQIRAIEAELAPTPPRDSASSSEPSDDQPMYADGNYSEDGI